VVEQDRRIRRTRRALHDALIELVLAEGYDRITVQDVLDRADVGRSTFYAHYRDKEALLTASFDDMREQLQREVDAQSRRGPVDPARPAELIFEHAYRNRRVYQAICGRRGGHVVTRHLHRMVVELLRGCLDPPAGLPVEVAAQFHASATIGLLTWWIDQDFRLGPAWLTGAYRALATARDAAVS